MSQKVNMIDESDQGITLEITTVTRIIVPSGSMIETNITGTSGAIVLPTGETLKSFVVFERNEEEDLDTQQMEELGCFSEDVSREIRKVK